MTSHSTQRNRANHGLVILDVDGVLFRRGLIIALVRKRSILDALRTAWDCIDFDLRRITLEELLGRSYGRLKGLSWAEAWETYQNMEIIEGAAKTISTLRTAGRYVVLMTAGVPDPMVKDLAVRLGADDGLGMNVETRNGKLTGRVSGDLAREFGKLMVTQRLLEAHGVRWADVTVVGDDANNLPIMRRAGTGIGFRAQHSVRHEARHLVEGKNLSAILPHCLDPRSSEMPGWTPAGVRPAWFREILRKILHMTAALVPVLAKNYPIGTTVLLLCCALFYFATECVRVYGAGIPLVREVGSAVLRRHERRQVAYAPLTLALGVLFVFWCMPQHIAFACILIVAFGDSVATVVGQHWGRVRLSYNRRKTFEGSAAFFVTSLVCALVYLPLDKALVLGVVATFIESLPLRDWDNFLTPVGTGFIASLLWSPT